MTVTVSGCEHRAKGIACVPCLSTGSVSTPFCRPGTRSWSPDPLPRADQSSHRAVVDFTAPSSFRKDSLYGAHPARASEAQLLRRDLSLHPPAPLNTQPLRPAEQPAGPPAAIVTAWKTRSSVRTNHFSGTSSGQTLCLVLGVIISFHPQNIPRRQHHCPCFTGGDAQAQNGQVSCPVSRAIAVELSSPPGWACKPRALRFSPTAAWDGGFQGMGKAVP